MSATCYNANDWYWCLDVDNDVGNVNLICFQQAPKCRHRWLQHRPKRRARYLLSCKRSSLPLRNWPRYDKLPPSPSPKKKNELTCTILHFIQLSFENLQKSLFYTLNKAILFRKLSLVSKNNLEGAKFANLRLLMPLKSFCKIKFSLVNLKFNFRPL